MPRLFLVIVVCTLLGDKYGFWYGVLFIAIDLFVSYAIDLYERYNTDRKGGDHGP